MRFPTFQDIVENLTVTIVKGNVSIPLEIDEVRFTPGKFIIIAKLSKEVVNEK